MSKSPLTFFVDVDAFTQLYSDFAVELEKDLQEAVKNLATTSHADILLGLENESSSIQAEYKKALSKPVEIEPGTWVITLDPKAFWIEEGINPNTDMKKWLLNEKSKQGQNGRYRIIPFKHSKTEANQTPKEQKLATDIKAAVNDKFKEMNKANRDAAAKNGTPKPANLSVKKLELDDNGSPRTGRLHSFNFGGDIPGKGNTPAMDGVEVYQTKQASGSVRRDIFTFRTVSESQSGKWIHPGFKRRQLMDKAMENANQLWETKILPEILRKYE